MALTPEQRSIRARIAAHARWSKEDPAPTIARAQAGLMDKFRYLSTSLVFLLVFVGTKMLLHDVFHIPELASLAMIGSILTVGVVASVVAGDKDTAALHAAPVPGEEDEFHSTLEDPNSSPHSR